MIKNIKRHLAVSLTAAAMVAAPLFANAEEKKMPYKVDVTFITASDMDTMTDNGTRGGAARMAAVVKAERANNANSVFAFPGDILSPSIMAGFDKGAHMIELLNMTPPDILAPGNHEFDFGQDVFLKRMSEGNFTKLGTNIRWGDGRTVDGIDDTKMFDFDGVKIGFMGLTTEDTPDISSPGDVVFLSVLETAKNTAAALRKEGADMVVAVVHTENAVDYGILNKSGVDVVLSGHDHNLQVYYDGKKALVESKEEAEYVTMMDIQFTVSEKRGKRRVKWWPNFRIVDTAKVTPDAEVAAVVKKYADTLSKELDVEIGKTNVELDSRKASVRKGETVIGNLIVDGMRAAVSADIGFTNGGGIRGNKIYEPDTVITRRDILTELPFGNTNVKLELTGKDIMAVLEHSARKLPETNGGFMAVSGMSFTIDTAKDTGSRVMDVKIGGEPIDMDKKYTASTNNFVANGGDGYKMLKTAKHLIDESSAKFMANDVMVHVRNLKEINNEIEGRITIK